MQRNRVRSPGFRAMTVVGVLATMVTNGCIDALGPRGEKCGGAQTASALAILPDTGIGGGAPVSIGLSQRDPFLIGELADLSVTHLWLDSNGVNPEANPRVRLVRDDGRVLLDTLSTRSIPNDGDPHRLSWIVFRTFSDSSLRNAIFNAIRTESLRLELWPPTGSAPGTVVRPRLEAASVGGIAICL